jgi:hypothetical protein
MNQRAKEPRVGWAEAFAADPVSERDEDSDWIEAPLSDCQEPLTPLKGSGKGVWGKNSSERLRKIREEWATPTDGDNVIE